MAKHVKLKVAERKLGREKRVGQYWSDKRLVEIDPRQKPKEHLDTLVHEVLHDAIPSFSERRINAVSRAVSRVLWAQSYRKVIGVK